LAAFLAAAFPAGRPWAAKGGEDKLAFMIEIDGAIGPATARQIEEGLTQTAERKGEVAILRLNTPGGLVTSTREIVAAIVASPVPVIGYVAPSGGHAASAGTFILYATHIAAMAPGTNIGAATPVEIGGGFPGLPGDDDKRGGRGKGQAPAERRNPMAEKATNDAVAFIRSLAEMRERNAEWAEKAVREAASLAANGALDQRVIEVIARDTGELLAQVDGRRVTLADGRTRTLATKGLAVETIEPGLLIEFLAVITDPNVAVILMLIGIYGLILEFSSPGAVAPGVIGTIALLLGLYALSLLPIDYAGLALMLLGIVFLVVEAYNPTVVLGLGGVIAFLLGAAMLMEEQAPEFAISWNVIGLAAAMLAGLTLLLGRFLWTARRRELRAGGEVMRGLSAEILDWQGLSGHVLAQGERWQARGDEVFAPGETVQVASVRDLTLLVKRAPRNDGESP
jgi:membrane-bound serine protease (ClpP class)